MIVILTSPMNNGLFKSFAIILMSLFINYKAGTLADIENYMILIVLLKCILTKEVFLKCIFLDFYN